MHSNDPRKHKTRELKTLNSLYLRHTFFCTAFKSHINHWVLLISWFYSFHFPGDKIFSKNHKKKILVEEEEFSLALNAVKEMRKISNYLKIFSIHLVSALVEALDLAAQKRVKTSTDKTESLIGRSSFASFWYPISLR